MPCIACGTQLRLLGNRGDHRYLVCRRCKAIQLDPMPSPDELAALYASTYADAGHYHADAAAHRAARMRVCQQILEMVRRVHPPSDSRLVVDLGAGWGTLVATLREAGHSVLGIEPSETMASHARSLGQPVVTGDLNDIEASVQGEGEVRTVVMMAVYEHLVDQEEVLRRLRRLLPRDGSLIIQCPTSGIPRALGPLFRPFGLPAFFGTLAPPWHVAIPSPDSLRLQAERAGLTVETVLPSRSGRDPGWKRFLQAANEWTARAGHRLTGERWPMAMGHLFLLRPAS